MTTVQPSAIHSQLNHLWDVFEGAGKMRASLFNLIFYTEKKAHADYVREIAHRVIEKYPSRIIFITANPTHSEGQLITKVDVLPVGKEVDVACDLIDIEVEGTALSRVPFLILPHLLPDLPIYLIWGEDPTLPNPLLPELIKISDRLIFDSETAQDLPSFARELLKLQKQSEIADLNWARIESWRQLLSSTFHSSERLAQLENIKSMQIFYNSRKTPLYTQTAVQALFLQGWLATQMNWTLQSVTNNRFIYKNQTGEITIELFGEEQDSLAPGIILSIDLTTQNEEHFSMGRELKFPSQVSMRFSTLEKCEIPLKYLFGKAESSLVREIGHKGTSEHFLKLLHAIANQKVG